VIPISYVPPGDDGSGRAVNVIRAFAAWLCIKPDGLTWISFMFLFFRYFDPGDGPLSNADNPPASVFSTMPHHQGYLPDMAYSSGTGYFWATAAAAGDSLQVIFDVAQNLSRIVVRTGHADYPKDILHSGLVFVSPTVTKVKDGIFACDSSKSVASFQNGIAIAEHLETVLSFRVHCLKVTVEVKHDHWVLFANVAVFLAR